MVRESGPEEDWRDAVRRGGFPRPALDLAEEEARRAWFDDCTRTYIERDLQDLSSIGALADFRRVMRAAALRAGQMVNQTEIARDLTAEPWVARVRLAAPPVAFAVVVAVAVVRNP